MITYMTRCVEVTAGRENVDMALPWFSSLELVPVKILPLPVELLFRIACCTIPMSPATKDEGSEMKKHLNDAACRNSLCGKGRDQSRNFQKNRRVHHNFLIFWTWLDFCPALRECQKQRQPFCPGQSSIHRNRASEKRHSVDEKRHKLDLVWAALLDW